MRRHVLPPAVALTLLAATTPASAATIERVDVLPAGVEPAYAAKARTQSADATGSRVVFSAGRTVYLRDRAAGQSLDLVQGLGGAAPNDISDTAVISDDGRVVAFASRAWNLVEGDGPESYFGNQTYDIYVRVLGTDGYERMSIASDGSAPPGRWGAVNPSISADGAYVAFETEQALHPDDGDGASDIYVRDRRNGVTELASTLGQATSANEPAISADGRVVAFATSEPLLADDTNEALDVYVRDMRTRALERVSVGENDQQADADAAYDTAISADGRFVVFSTIAEGLVAGDDRGWDDRDVFVRDRVAGTTEIASIGGAGRQVDGDAGSVDISGDGRFVSFSYESYGPLADRLVPTDDDRVGHVRDRQLRRTRTLRDVETNDCCFAQWFELTSDGRHALWKGYAHDFGDDVGGNDHYSHVYLADVEPGADGEPPALEVPEDRVVAARDATGVTVRYAARATDANDPAPELGCSPGSGARFPLGTTTVRCLAVDEAGNEATAAFSVDVRDARAPLLMLPERIALDDDGSGGAVLVDTFAAVDDVDGTRPAACELPPDRRFAVGEHVVLCSASDAAGNRAEGSFTLVVRPSSPAPTLSVADIRLSERVRWQAVQVTRTGPATSELLLPVTVWPGTARRPLDFDSDAQSVFFAAGQRQATIWIAPRDDHKDEAEETLTVHVDGLSLGLRTASGTLTLLDDDPPRAPSRRRVEVGPLFYVGAGGRALVKVDPAASEPAPEIVRTFDGTIGRPSVSPDGTSVLVVERRAGSSRLLRVPVDGGAPAEIELQWDADGVLGGGDAGATRVREPAWNPDGRSFAVLADADCDCSAGLIGWFPAAGGPLIDAYSTRGATERLTWAPDGARLAFAEDSPDATGQELTILDVETGERVSLTDTPDVDESDPAWSPDGRALAFTRIDRDTGARTLARMAPEAGSGITVLAGAPGRRLMEPAWAPDSSRIAFVERDDARPPGEADRLRSVRPDGEDLRSHADESQSPRRPDWAPGPRTEPTAAGRLVLTERLAGGAQRVVAVDGDGGNRRVLADTGTDVRPRVSGDGSLIAFGSSRAARPQIFAMTAAGRNQRALDTGDGPAGEPDPSPDGTWLAYSRNAPEHGDDASGFDIWVAGVDGSAPQQLTSMAGAEGQPAIAPGAGRIAFTAGVGSAAPAIHVVAADGSGLRRLADGHSPAWSPEGERIAFVRPDAQGIDQVWVMRADGSDPQPLSSVAAGARSPSFSPDGLAIAFAAADGIWRMHDDGTGPVRVTSGAHADVDWSVDPPPPRVSVRSAQALEGSGAVHVALALSFEPDAPVVVDVTTADGTAGAGADYVALAGAQVRFEPGQRERTITVTLIDDALDEPDRSFTVGLSGATGATIGDGEAEVAIVDDDAPPEVSIADATVVEGRLGTSDAVFVVSLSAPSGRETAVHARTSDGTAGADDYDAVAEVLLFPAGVTERAFRVPVAGDTRDESDETFSVLLSALEHLAPGRLAATGTIADDDEDPGTGSEPPDTLIDSGPSPLGRDAAPVLTFRSTVPGEPFECRVVPADFARCSSPHRLRALVDGKYRFEVRALDGTLADPTPASREFTIDTVAPDTALVAVPRRISGDAAPVFRAASDDPTATLSCRLTGAMEVPWTACGADWTPGRLADGDYTFSVRAADGAGNEDPTPAAHAFRIDTTPPQTRLERPDDAAPSPVPPQAQLRSAAAGAPLTVSPGGTAGIAVGCPADASAACEGRLLLYEAPSRGAAFARVAAASLGVPLSTAAFVIRPGDTRRVPLRLSASARERIERRGATDFVAIARTTAEGAVAEVRQTVALAPDPRLPRLRSAGASVRPSGGRLPLRLACDTATSCRGGVLVTVRHRGRRIVLGSARYRVRAGRTAAVQVQLEGAARRLLRRTGGGEAAVRVHNITRASKTLGITIAAGGGR